MTLTDIGRLLKVAKVPHSKTVKQDLSEVKPDHLRGKLHTWQQPHYTIHVPATHYMVIANVVGNLKLNTNNVTVVLLEDANDVRPGEHVLYHIEKNQKPFQRNPYMAPDEVKEARRRHNWHTVVTCASVTLQ